MKKSFVLSLCILVSLWACSTKNAGITNRTYHSITSWNNALYNGDVALDRNILAKKESFRDDYADILNVEPIEYFASLNSQKLIEEPSGSIFKNSPNLDINNESTPPSDITQQKAQKAIDKHSMLIDGEQRNKMMERAYVMLGRSYMYSGDFFQAINAFNQVDKDFQKEKRKILANTYKAEAQGKIGNNFDAEKEFQKLLQTKLKKSQKSLLAKKYAQFLIDQKEYQKSIEVLNVGYKVSKGKATKGRYRFIQGQLYQKLGDIDNAREHYYLAFKKRPGYEMEVKSEMAISALFDPKKDDYKAYEERLKKLAKKGTYKAQQNEIYYALGKLAVSVDSLKKGEAYYQKSLSLPESDKQVHSLAFLGMGDLLYKKADYINASKYYDSAFALMEDPDSDFNLVKKNLSLKKLVLNYAAVHTNDSILNLVNMGENQRIEYFSSYVAKLKAKETQQAEDNETQFGLSSNNNNFTYGSSGKFYFYNESLKASGRQEFVNKWGNRQLRDNWRYSSMMGTNAGADNSALNVNTQDPKRFDVEYYTSQIPTSREEIQNLKITRDTAELNLGIIYYENFHDDLASVSSLKHLLDSQPQEEDVRIKAHYYLSLAAKSIDPALANNSKEYLVKNFPNNKYTQFAQNPELVGYFDAKSSVSVKLYDETYTAYENKEYQKVIDNSQRALNLYPKDQIIAKFALLSAYAYGKMGMIEQYRQALEQIVLLFEGTPEQLKAQQLLTLLN